MQLSIDAIVRQSGHTRESDRAAVLRVLEDWDLTGIVVENLVDEVEYLSRWDVGEILKKIEHLLEYRDVYRPPDAWGGAPRQIIRLRRWAPGGEKNFSGCEPSGRRAAR